MQPLHRIPQRTVARSWQWRNWGRGQGGLRFGDRGRWRVLWLLALSSGEFKQWMVRYIFQRQRGLNYMHAINGLLELQLV